MNNQNIFYVGNFNILGVGHYKVLASNEKSIEVRAKSMAMRVISNITPPDSLLAHLKMTRDEYAKLRGTYSVVLADIVDKHFERSAVNVSFVQQINEDKTLEIANSLFYDNIQEYLSHSEAYSNLVEQYESALAADDPGETVPSARRLEMFILTGGPFGDAMLPITLIWDHNQHKLKPENYATPVHDAVVWQINRIINSTLTALSIRKTSSPMDTSRFHAGLAVRNELYQCTITHLTQVITTESRLDKTANKSITNPIVRSTIVNTVDEKTCEILEAVIVKRARDNPSASDLTFATAS